MQAIGRDEGFGIDFTGDKLQEEPPSLKLLNLHFLWKKAFLFFLNLWMKQQQEGYDGRPARLDDGTFYSE